MFRGARRGLVALTALAGALLAVLVGVGFGVLFWSISDMRQANLAERHAVAAQDQARLVDLLVIDEETYQRGYVIARQPEFLGPWKTVQGHFPVQARKLVNVSTSPAQRTRAQGIMRAGEAYIRDYSIPVVRLAQRGDPRATSPSVTLDGKHRVDAIRGLFDTYTTAESATVAAREATTDSDAQHAAVAGAVGVGASVLLIAAYSGYVTRVIVLPVRRAARLAGRLAEGDLTARMPRTGAREIGQLETSFNSMAGSLQHSIEQAQEAHRRLRLLYDASMAVGTTLDVAHTARELVGVAVPRFADFATVDLAVSVLQGGEPAPAAGTRLRRVARDGVRDDVPLDPVGAVIRPALHVPEEPGTGSGALFVHDLRASTGWQDRSPEEAGRLLDYGMNSLIIAPLVEQGVLMGIVTFWRGHASRPFEKEDVADAEELALKAALAIDNARRYTRERETALTLQRSLLPQRLPEQPAVEVAHRYLPASTRAGVGGDWLDVIPLSGARVALVVGDVVGHGIHASATMGRLRTAVRTLADVDLPPDELLTQLDDLVMHLPGAAVGEETGGGSAGGREVGAVTGMAGVAGAGREAAGGAAAGGAAGAAGEIAAGEAGGAGVGAEREAAARTGKEAASGAVGEGAAGEAGGAGVGAGREAAAGAAGRTAVGGLGVAAGELGGTAGELGATCLYAVYDPISRRCTLAGAGHPWPFVIAPDGTVTAVTGHTGPPLGVGGLPFETTELELAPGSTLALYSDGLVHSRDLDVGQGQDRLRAALASAAGSADSLDDACGAVVDTLLTGPPADDVALLLARTRAFSSDQVVTWDIPADPEQVAGARTLATRQLEAWQLEEASFVTELVVSELVTNAIRYGTPPIQLRLIRTMPSSGSAAGALVCEVSDGSNTAPHMRRARVFDEGGRGLLLVAQLTQRWGTRHSMTGKTIWCEQALPAPGRWD